MGDRAMAEIITSEGSLYVYTHWGGYYLPRTAANAIIKAKNRWTDFAYAMRIIVDQLIKEGRDSETGFGLMLEPIGEDEYNNDKPSVIIDLVTPELRVHRNGKSRIYSFYQLPEMDGNEINLEV
jgi:hypothetical protein